MTYLKKIISSKHFTYLFYGLWFLVAFWQASFTELLSDEAYYWKYSQFLEWGYFDHPPMVALLIKIGSNLLPGELGVRLLFVLLGTATIYLIQRLINPFNKSLFYVIISSIGLLYFTSFLALPDVPLLFFTALLFLQLKHFLENNAFWTACLMGLTIACLLLSKYHGFVIILIALLANLHLLKKPSFYVIILIALIAVTPHFLWQLNHDFPSIQYHFHDRNLDAYILSNTVNYILVQLILFGPFMGLFLWIGFFKTKLKNHFEKVLFWQVIGIFSFFLLLTFNGRVQAHWTSILLIPLVYFGYDYLNKNVRLRKWAYYQWPVAILLIATVKIGLVFNLPFGDDVNKIFKDFKGKSLWAKTIRQTTGSTPIVFMNSYQNASIYEFYSGELAITISNVMSRKNQYDLWQYEDSLRGKTVALIPNYFINDFDTLHKVVPFTQYKSIDNFQHYGQVNLLAPNWTVKQPIADSISVNDDNLTFNENLLFPSFISYTYFEDNHFISQHRSAIHLNSILSGTFQLRMKTPSKKSKYQVYFSIQTGWLPPSLNSKVYVLELF